MVRWSTKVKVSPVFCDKLTFVIGYKTTDERQHVRSRLAAMKKSVHGNYAYPGGQRKYKIGCQFYVEPLQQGATMLIQADPKVMCDHFIRVEYNPATADPPTVYSLLDQVLPGGWFDIATAAICTRFDVTVDLTGIGPEALLVNYSGMQRSRVFCKGGKTETYEMGRYDADKRVVVYDKQAQIRRWNEQRQFCKLPVPERPTTRIEIVMRPSRNFMAMAQLTNPFTGLHVHCVPPMELASTVPFRLFIVVAQLKGLQDALLMLPEAMRKQFKNTLEMSSCAWWQPADIWAGWPKLLLDLLHVSDDYRAAVVANAVCN